MLPIILDTDALSIALVSENAQRRATQNRLAMLAAAGAGEVRVFADALPNEQDLAAINILYIVDVGDDAAAELATAARAAKCLVNVEDVKPHCDFHVPSQVRRGDLLFTVSTNGKSPALSVRLREWLAANFPDVWGERLAQVAIAREQWRGEGLGFAEISSRTNALVDKEGWL